MLKQSPGLQSYKGFGVPTIGRYTPKGTFYRGERPGEYSARMLKEKGDSLAQFSGINPESIVGNQTPTKETALKLISGDTPLGSSIASTAANKIVGFNRPGVAPKSSGMGGILETLTPSITNNTTNILGNKKSPNVFNTNIIKNILGSSNKKEQGGGLFSFISGALDKVKEALAFVTFVGSKKNLDRIRDNIQNLKLIFTETFDVAKALRKAIIKIFKQLSGIDTSGGGGGGGGGIIGLLGRLIGGIVGGYIIRLIRKIFPGFKGFKGAKAAEEGVEEGSRLGRLGRVVGGGARVAEEGGILSKIGKFLPKLGKPGKILAGGLAVAGTAAAISGLSKPGEQEGEVQPDGSPMDIPGTILDKFNSILDRFDKVLDGLLKGGKGPDKKGGGSSGGSSGGASPGGSSGGASPGGGGGGTPPGPGTGILPTADTPQAEALLKTIQQAEGSDYNTIFGGAKIPQLTKMTLNEVINMGNTGKLPPRFGGGSAGYASGSRATAAYQFMPGTLENLKTKLGLKGNETFDSKFQDRLALSLVAGRGVNPNAPINQESIKKLSGEWASFPGNTYTFGGKAQPRYSEQQIESMYQKNLGYVSSVPSAPTLPPPGTPPTSPPSTSSTRPASGTPQTRPAPSQQAPETRPTSPTRPSVVQPAPNQPQAAQLTQAAQSTTSQPNVSVINTGQAQQPSKPSGSGTISLPSPPKNGPSVPFPSPKNPDNFLVFYSRLTYNIIDG